MARAGFYQQTVLTKGHLGKTMLMQIVFFPDDQQRCLLIDKGGKIFIGCVATPTHLSIQTPPLGGGGGGCYVVPPDMPSTVVNP